MTEQTFWKKHETQGWNLVAAGPSIAHLRPEHLLEGPVVTVNRAMLTCYEKKIPVDYAAIADGPNGCWETCNMEAHWKPPTLIWCTGRPVMQRVPIKSTNEIPASRKKNIVHLDGKPHMELPGPHLFQLWDQALPSSIGVRLMPWANVPDPDDPQKRHRIGFTTLCAFVGIMRYNPRTIRVLCMDMKGSWIPGMSEESCHAFDMKRDHLDRWTHERRTMTSVFTEARSKGIRVEEVTPEPLETESLDGAVVH